MSSDVKDTNDETSSVHHQPSKKKSTKKMAVPPPRHVAPDTPSSPSTPVLASSIAITMELDEVDRVLGQKRLDDIPSIDPPTPDTSKASYSISPNTTPTIATRIISHSDRRSLLVLRSASRAFRDRVDAALTEHIVITASKHTPARVSVSSHQGRIPCFRPIDGDMVVSPTRREQCDKALAATRVVDLGVRGPSLAPIAAALSNVQLVRIVHAPTTITSLQIPIRGRKSVTFIDATTPCPCLADPVRDADNFRLIPGFFKKLVINVRYDGSRAPPTEPWALRCLLLETVRRQHCSDGLVVVLHNVELETRSRSKPTASGSAAYKPPSRWGILFPLLATAVSLAKVPITCTIVGMDQVNPRWLGFDNVPSADLPGLWLKDATELMQKKHPEINTPFFRNRRFMRFVTKDEYKASLPGEEWHLETVWR